MTHNKGETQRKRDKRTERGREGDRVTQNEEREREGGERGRERGSSDIGYLEALKAIIRTEIIT